MPAFYSDVHRQKRSDMPAGPSPAEEGTRVGETTLRERHVSLTWKKMTEGGARLPVGGKQGGMQ